MDFSSLHFRLVNCCIYGNSTFDFENMVNNGKILNLNNNISISNQSKIRIQMSSKKSNNQMILVLIFNTVHISQDYSFSYYCCNII